MQAESSTTVINKSLTIYQLIPMVMNDVGAVKKSGYNNFDKYKFRSIDDVYNSLQPVLAKHGVFIAPKTIDSVEHITQTKAGADQLRIKVKVEYTIYASDGSHVVSIFEGEGIDRSDKATNKAMQAAFKYMCSQLFCLAFEEMEDADKETIPLKENNQKKPEQKPTAQPTTPLPTPKIDQQPSKKAPTKQRNFALGDYQVPVGKLAIYPKLKVIPEEEAIKWVNQFSEWLLVPGNKATDEQNEVLRNVKDFFGII